MSLHHPQPSCLSPAEHTANADPTVKKVQTQKDLRKVIDHLGKYDEKRVVLLDDSPLKGVYQPWSQIVITEYDKPEFMASKEAIMRLAKRAQELKITTESTTSATLPVADSPPASAEAASSAEVASMSKLDLEEKEERHSGADENPDSNTDITHEPGLDTTLLAVVGILEAMRNVQNVPAFIRGGGIQSPSSTPLVDGDVNASTLPSHETFAHWFANAETLDYWTQRGKKALQRRNIELDQGMRFSPTGEFFPLTNPNEQTTAPPPVRNAEGSDAKPEVKGKLLKGKKAEAAYRHLQAVAQGELVNEHQRSAVWAALQVLHDIGLAPGPAGPAGSRSVSPESPQDAVSATSEPSDSKKRPRYQASSQVPAEQNVEME